LKSSFCSSQKEFIVFMHNTCVDTATLNSERGK
jgi:hypothetical protein